MAAPQLGSYSSSTALSPQHYKLVRQVEQARTAEDTNRVLLDCLVTIKTSWAKRAPSPSTARHDLVLVLYARSQRAQPLARPLDPVAEELFEAAWALPVAVKLAGGAGRADLTNRNLGYRACTELFSPLEPHSLKLLLVNTIRSDLYAPLGTDKAEARWASSLRAAASPALASPELAPAVRERVLELMLDRHYSNPIRRLALETLLSLARCTADNTSSRPTSLVAEARNAVLTLVLPPPPSASSSAAGRSGRGRSSTPRRPDLSLAFLAALASALSPSSPLHPVVPDAAQRVELGVQLCRRILAAPEEDEPRTRYKGVRGLWVTERALKVLRDELGQAVAADAGHDARGEAAVRELVWELVEKMLETANEASDAVLLSALSLLPFLSTALPAGSPDSPTLRRLLSHLHSHLVRRSSPVALLFALRALAHLPPTTWATVDDDKGKARDDDASASGGTPWGEPAWSSILAGLDDPDSTVRRATLALLTRVDAKLVEIQYERLLALASAPESVGVDSGRSTSSLASGRSSSGKRRPMSRTLERVLEVLPFLSPAPTSSPAPSSSTLPLAQRLLALLARPELGLEATTVLPGLVVRVLHAFQYAPLEAQRSFAHEILFGEGGEWKQGVVAGLWAAGTVHAFEQDEAGKAEEMLGKWLTQDQGSTNPDLVALLQEPFLFALLRLLALHPGLDIPSTLSNDLARAAARAVSPETARLFSVVKQCISPADSHVLATLHAVAARTRPAPLGEFGAALLAALDAHDGAPEPTPPPRPGPSASSRLHHPPPAPSSAPLRYSYSPPRSPVEAPRPDSASAALARSSAALAREQADLLRERSERGGRGARKGEPVETIKTPRLRVGELRDESDGEEERVREEEDSSGGRARGEAEEDVGETSGEPPADLLIELESLDPFRAAHAPPAGREQQRVHLEARTRCTAPSRPRRRGTTPPVPTLVARPLHTSTLSPTTAPSFDKHPHQSTTPTLAPLPASRPPSRTRPALARRPLDPAPRARHAPPRCPRGACRAAPRAAQARHAQAPASRSHRRGGDDHDCRTNHSPSSIRNDDNGSSDRARERSRPRGDHLDHFPTWRRSFRHGHQVGRQRAPDPQPHPHERHLHLLVRRRVVGPPSVQRRRRRLVVFRRSHDDGPPDRRHLRHRHRRRRSRRPCPRRHRHLLLEEAQERQEGRRRRRLDQPRRQRPRRSRAEPARRAEQRRRLGEQRHARRRRSLRRREQAVGAAVVLEPRVVRRQGPRRARARPARLCAAGARRRPPRAARQRARSQCDPAVLPAQRDGRQPRLVGACERCRPSSARDGRAEHQRRDHLPGSAGAGRRAGRSACAGSPSLSHIALVFPQPSSRRSSPSFNPSAATRRSSRSAGAPLVQRRAGRPSAHYRLGLPRSSSQPPPERGPLGRRRRCRHARLAVRVRAPPRAGAARHAGARERRASRRPLHGGHDRAGRPGRAGAGEEQEGHDPGLDRRVRRRGRLGRRGRRGARSCRRPPLPSSSRLDSHDRSVQPSPVLGARRLEAPARARGHVRPVPAPPPPAPAPWRARERGERPERARRRSRRPPRQLVLAVVPYLGRLVDVRLGAAAARAIRYGRAARLHAPPARTGPRVRLEGLALAALSGGVGLWCAQPVRRDAAVRALDLLDLGRGRRAVVQLDRGQREEQPGQGRLVVRSAAAGGGGARYWSVGRRRLRASDDHAAGSPVVGQGRRLAAQGLDPPACACTPSSRSQRLARPVAAATALAARRALDAGRRGPAQPAHALDGRARRPAAARPPRHARAVVVSRLAQVVAVVDRLVALARNAADPGLPLLAPLDALAPARPDRALLHGRLAVAVTVARRLRAAQGAADRRRRPGRRGRVRQPRRHGGQAGAAGRELPQCDHVALRHVRVSAVARVLLFLSPLSPSLDFCARSLSDPLSFVPTLVTRSSLSYRRCVDISSLAF